MPELQIATEAYSRAGGGAEFTLFNMLVEESPAAPSGFVRRSRHGLVSAVTRGFGPINGLFSREGVFAGDLFALSSSTLYRGAAILGTVAGTAPVSWASSPYEVVLTRGGSAYSYDGDDLVAIELEDDPFAVVSVAYLNGLFVFLTATGRFYWSATNDARTIDGLDYANAESAADGGLDVYVVQDGLWFMGSSTVEFWQYTGDEDAPFSRVEGRLFKRGIKATGCAAELDNGLFWWGDDDAIYRAAEVPQRISNRAIEEKLAGSIEKKCFSLTHQGHPLFCLRTDSGTFVYDVSTQRWQQWGTKGKLNWRVQNAATSGNVLYLGDDASGALWTFDPANRDDGDVLERRFSAYLPILGGAVPIHTLGVVANSGQTPLLEEQGSDPILEIRASRDNGQRFGDFRQAKLGRQGRFRQKIEKRVWGLFDMPGALFEMRCTDPIDLVVTSVYANEPGGGRGRGGK